MKSEAAESFRHGSREESGQLYFVRRHKKYRSKRHVACSDVVTRRGFEPRTHCLKGSCSAD